MATIEAVMRYTRRERVIAERSGDRTVVLDADGTTLTTLSPIGALLWEQLPCDVDEAVTFLKSRFPDVDEDVFVADVTAFFDDLVAHSLIVHDAES